MKNKNKFVMLILFALLFTACGAGEDNSLEGSSWQLMLIDNHSIPKGASITINFNDGQTSGIAACNHYSGEYTLSSANAFSTGELSMTEMYCSDESLNQLETVYIEALGEVTSAMVKENELILFGKFGKMIFVLIDI